LRQGTAHAGRRRPADPHPRPRLLRHGSRRRRIPPSAWLLTYLTSPRRSGVPKAWGACGEANEAAAPSRPEPVTAVSPRQGAMPLSLMVAVRCHKPETGLRSRWHPHHHDPRAPATPERHETAVRCRPGALELRFHYVMPWVDDAARVPWIPSAPGMPPEDRPAPRHPVPARKNTRI
jgi:hypothetical protein